MLVSDNPLAPGPNKERKASVRLLCRRDFASIPFSSIVSEFRLDIDLAFSVKRIAFNYQRLAVSV